MNNLLTGTPTMWAEIATEKVFRGQEGGDTLRALREANSALVVLSGGMDSTVLLYLMRELVQNVGAVSFDYGQRHRRELAYAELTAWTLRIPHSVIDLAGFGESVTSALTAPHIEVPHGMYDAENMKATIVPNRNMVMLSIAAGVAMSNALGWVVTAVHAGDHAIYPDCRPEFIAATDRAVELGTGGMVRVGAPFVNLSKTEIVEVGDLLQVRWEHTWSCYEGGDRHCGMCGTCVERIEAFHNARVSDKVSYNAKGYAMALLRNEGRLRE